MSKNAPRDARELVGKGDGEHVMMQPLLGGLDPRPELMALPIWPVSLLQEQTHAACTNRTRKVAIAECNGHQHECLGLRRKASGSRDSGYYRRSLRDESACQT